MKPPKKVKVGPFVFDLTFSAEICAAAGVTGACMPDELRLWLDPRCADGVLRDTVLHELMHGIWKQSSLEAKYPDEDPDSPGEVIIKELANRLLLLLRENPKLVEYLTER